MLGARRIGRVADVGGLHGGDERSGRQYARRGSESAARRRGRPKWGAGRWGAGGRGSGGGQGFGTRPPAKTKRKKTKRKRNKKKERI